ncbi:alpha/beta hydrolase [Pseudidiomarina sp. 1APP75-32.1]|uniref:Alpha/beta hydrolase n=1 Tax=Pseudidiomarina terrestris TaxID=2820060 RepID=A0AAW7QX66_9GAMM|nr:MULTISPECIES: alpha/beta hydrolase [unclassified Pseudidiomarina]MDN7123420.1 alpha/beta hydrolase [Pseudidiomarina sp. 1APP75-32.1]MDN7128855.1 alpha/beta hydrolase [Pseudidiomarina sp. 1APR75-15]MDN7137560.1 alpha/beta hydrolase [Pseudidiomarina sp. 1ASP75-14]MEA3587330.1 alpha/beta hydrolase [Pseudidiomarina sp. 1APP75-27a]
MTNTYTQARQHAEPVSFQLNWGSVAGLRWGNANGKPILALHGWLDNGHSFLPLAQQFLTSDLAKSHQLLAIDWPGHGLSQHRPAGNYYPFLDYVYDLVQLCEQQNWQQVEVVAHSMGAFVGNLWAGIEPQRVRHLLAIEAFGLLSSPETAILDDIRQGFRSRLQQQGKRRPHYPNFDAAVLARQQAGDFDTEVAQLLVERGLEQLAEDDFRFRADGQLRTKSVLRLTPLQIRSILAAIECPIKLVLGSHGHRERIELALQQWQDAVPQLEIVEAAGGHHVHMEQPDAVWREFTAMLA